MKVLFVAGLIVTLIGAFFLNTAIIILGFVLMVLSAIGEAILTIIRKKSGGKTK